MENKRGRQKLTPEQYHIMWEKGTETPFSGQYVHTKDKGMYTCAACGNKLFSSNTKFDSGTGWPSFDQAIPGSVKMRPDNDQGARLPTPDAAGYGGQVTRTEVTCARCGAHLGHVFDDGPRDTTGKRFCINSACLLLEKDKKKDRIHE